MVAPGHCSSPGASPYDPPASQLQLEWRTRERLDWVRTLPGRPVPFSMQEQSKNGAQSAQEVDPVSVASERYGAAFPEAEIAAIHAHLTMLHASNELQQAVGRFLSDSGFNITGPRYSLLRLLYLTRERSLPQGEIARALNVTSANVTQLIDGLERDGMVERVVSAPDRRVTYARLTPAGEQRCAEMVPAVVSLMEQTFGMFSNDEKLQLVALLSKFRRELRSRFNLRERAVSARALDPEAP
jgi:MarR family transcriptional regulator, 2-MHQ and catechol-resistance regulon repressor